jgi:hypothetical protein
MNNKKVKDTSILYQFSRATFLISENSAVHVGQHRAPAADFVSVRTELQGWHHELHADRTVNFPQQSFARNKSSISSVFKVFLDEQKSKAAE